MLDSELDFLRVREYVAHSKGNFEDRWTYKNGDVVTGELYSPFATHANREFRDDILIEILAGHGIGLRVGGYVASEYHTAEWLAEWGQKYIGIYADNPRARALYWRVSDDPRINEPRGKKIINPESLFEQPSRDFLNIVVDDVLQTVVTQFQEGLDWAEGRLGFFKDPRVPKV